MTARGRVAMAALILIAIVQVTIPTLALFEQRPVRFGWQMYSTLSAPPQAEVEHPDGRLTAVDLQPLVADFRAEIHWSQPLVEHLCGDADVRAVVVTDRDGTNRVPCR